VTTHTHTHTHTHYKNTHALHAAGAITGFVLLHFRSKFAGHSSSHKRAVKLAGDTKRQDCQRFRRKQQTICSYSGSGGTRSRTRLSNLVYVSRSVSTLKSVLNVQLRTRNIGCESSWNTDIYPRDDGINEQNKKVDHARVPSKHSRFRGLSDYMDSNALHSVT
jgi:hypothetical protein